MKRSIKDHGSSVFRFLGFAFAACLALPSPVHSASVSLATEPLTTLTPSNVKPNVMYIIDDSGTMKYKYLPDWANGAAAPLSNNAAYNGVYYNPAITYTPPVFYTSTGALDTTTYPSNSSPWTSVPIDGFKVISTSTSNLVGSASYYTIVPGEYCKAQDLKDCVAQTAPTPTYPYAAPLRWCSSTTIAAQAAPTPAWTATTGCQSINNSPFTVARYPVSATAKITVGTSSAVTSITVGGKEILSVATTASGTTSTDAQNIANAINRCTATPRGNCTTEGFFATVSTNVVTITANGPGFTSTPSVTPATGKTVTAFSGGNKVPGSNRYISITNNGDGFSYPGTMAKALGRTDCAGTTCTYTEEMTNYANWYSYYQTRLQAMKSSVSRAFKSLNQNYRVGFSTLCDTAATTSTKTFLEVGAFEKQHKYDWYKMLFAASTGCTTPLRSTLAKVGKYYANKIGAVDPVQYSCQQNFAILSTDGYWNDPDDFLKGSFSLKGTSVGDMDKDATTRSAGIYEGPTTSSDSLADIAKYYFDTDLRNNTWSNCAGGASTDFPSGNPDVCTDDVFTSSTDKNVKQHMTTFTMGLGADGLLNFTTDYKTATSGDFYNLTKGINSTNWPDPKAATTGTSSIQSRIDDLWHAAVNGNGTYFSAKDPDAIVKGFSEALSSISTKLGSASAAATSTMNPVTGDNYAYIGSYTTIEWIGNLEARTININNGAVSDTATWCVENIKAASCNPPSKVVPDTSGSSTIYNCVEPNVVSAAACVSPGVYDSVAQTCATEIVNSCIGTLPPMVSANGDSRNIYTPKGDGTLMAFSAANLAGDINFSAAHISGLTQWNSFTPAQQATAEGANLVNYLRGQNGFEMRAVNAAHNRLYRARTAVMGDVLESKPYFIAAPVFNYPYSGYSAFKLANSPRSGTVYVAANDGMLHAFHADTGVERWAYVPNVIIPNLWKLADSSYSTQHANFINGSVQISDICAAANCATATAADWKTILVGGLNGGGRGFYALDITDPVTPKFLWEFTAAQDADLGYSYGRPNIVRKADGTWVVVLTSGFDNGTLSSDPAVNNSPKGSGGGFLYVLNANSGSLISKIPTSVGGVNVGTAVNPSGLNQIAIWNDEEGGNKAGYAYGGDLLGNVWRFDINTTSVTATVGTGAAFEFATLADASAVAQPITTKPLLGAVSTSTGAIKNMVFVGTGKYLEKSDLTTMQTQSIYAMKDDGATNTTTLVNPRAHTTAPKMVKQTITPSGSVRTGTSVVVDLNYDQGWYVDFPDVASGSERAVVEGMLVSGTLAIPTTVPSNKACTPGGYSWLNYFNYADGSPVKPSASSTNTNVSKKYDSVIVGLFTTYSSEGKARFGVVDATGNITTEGDIAKPPATPSFKSIRTIWREVR